MISERAKIDVVADNERVRIQRFTLPPGASTGRHTHSVDYVIVPYGVCRIRVDLDSGPVEATMSEAEPYFRRGGVTHDVTNIMEHPISFLEIELK